MFKLNTLLLSIYLSLSSINFKEIYYTTKSASLFHVSLFYNYVKLGKIFNFNQIAGEEKSRFVEYDEIDVYFDKFDNIISLNDGKKCPLVLGSIVRTQQNLEELAKTFNIDLNKIAICSMNRDFERDWAGLTELLSKNKSIKLYKYPTTDYTPPMMVDVIRAVRDIENRDLNNHSLMYVHCKAGKARSATIIAAYIIHLMHKNKKNYITVENVEFYLKKLRSHVDLNSNLKHLLNDFQFALKEAQNFENLCLIYKDQILERENNLY